MEDNIYEYIIEIYIAIKYYRNNNIFFLKLFKYTYL